MRCGDGLTQLKYGYLDEKAEYHGQFDGCRKTCKECKFSKHEIELGDYKKHCTLLNMNIHESNNVCNQFQSYLNNKPFNYGAYFEWLMNDYYRPYKGTDEVAYYIDRPSWYQYDKRLKIPVHKTIDCSYCTLHVPDCHVFIDKYCFQIDYKRFKDASFYDGESIFYKIFYYKEKEVSRKYISFRNGSVKLSDLL